MELATLDATAQAAGVRSGELRPIELVRAAIERIEKLDATLNAVVHRDYAIAAPIQIRVYTDRLLIWNRGELPENWLLGPHPSQPYNPDVANAFFRAREIEA